MCQHNDEDWGCELCPDLFDEVIKEMKHVHIMNNEICKRCKKPIYEIMDDNCILEIMN